MKRNFTKQQQKTFESKVIELLGGEKLDKESYWGRLLYDYELNTKFGQFVYNIDNDSEILTVFGRFVDENRPKGSPFNKINPFNGKFNFHFAEGDPIELAEKVKMQVDGGILT
jgi:hypothetical protein